jgi:hypothetical protein
MCFPKMAQAVSILGRLAARYCGKDCITGIQARFITGFPMGFSHDFPGGGSSFKFPLNQSIECSFYIHHIYIYDINDYNLWLYNIWIYMATIMNILPT